MFIVVMVITLLTAIGIFAARSAGLVNAAAGYSRQALQTQYVAELGNEVVLGEFGSGAGPAYLEQLRDKPDECLVTRDQPEPAPNVKPPCVQRFRSEVEPQVQGGVLLEAGTARGLGSLSSFIPTDGTGLEGDFRVEVSDPGPAGRPIAGTDVGGTGTSFGYMMIAFTTYGQVRSAPSGVVTTCDEVRAAGAGVQTVRSHVIVGPLPK